MTKGNKVEYDIVKDMMRRDKVSREEAIQIIMDEYDETSLDAEKTLHNLGFEPDYIFNLFDVLART